MTHPDQNLGNTFFSQNGEDILVVNLFAALGVDLPSYLDLGAHHPSVISNTKLFYDRGSRGVNVEANPNMIQAFFDERPGDVNVNVGVGVVAGRKDFYMYDERSGLNTFCTSEIKNFWPSTWKVAETMQLPVLTLAQIVDKYCEERFPDLLSVDLEGLDYDVLDNADFTTSFPKIVIVETRIFDTRRMCHMMSQQGYFSVCRMGENLIFVHEDYYPLIEGPKK